MLHNAATYIFAALSAIAATALATWQVRLPADNLTATGSPAPRAQRTAKDCAVANSTSLSVMH
jgi:hypothetical protein